MSTSHSRTFCLKVLGTNGLAEVFANSLILGKSIVGVSDMSELNSESAVSY